MLKQSFRNTVGMSNSLDPDQARRFVRFVGPDLGPNCLPRVSADDTPRQRVEAVGGNKTSMTLRKHANAICRDF